MEIQHWQYETFDLDRMNSDKCDIFYLKDIFQLPEDMIMYNRLEVDTTEAVCVVLKRFAYPCRYSDMVLDLPSQSLNYVSFVILC